MTIAIDATDVADRTQDLFGRKHDGSFFEIDGSMLPQDLDQLLLWCGNRKASDVRIQTDLPVIAEIGGALVRVTRRTIRASEIDGIMRYLYAEHAPGMLKAAYDIDTAHEVRMSREEGGIKRYRVNMTAIRIPNGDGVQITIRTLPAMPIDIKDLGIEKDILENIRPESGMIMVTGPTGSGKSTLLSSMIRSIVEQEDANEVVLEYSSPIEYVYDGVKTPSAIIAQTEVGKHLVAHDGAGNARSQESLYAYAVRNSLRRKPSIILIGETRDEATMQASLEAALTGHLLYSTLHTIGVPAGLRRAVQFFAADHRESAAMDVMETLRMIVTQVLRPRIGGGRIALREYMIFDDRTRATFMNRHPNEWPALARRMMNDNKVQSKKLVTSAWEAFAAGQLSQAHYKKIVNMERNTR